MMNLVKTKIGRLRLIGFLEGISLLVLVFIGMPMKYYFQSPGFNEVLGPIHGVAFLLFIFSAISVGVEQSWKFTTTGVVLLSSFIPFGTFYVDKRILSKI
jgi:integral membrane protein